MKGFSSFIAINTHAIGFAAVFWNQTDVLIILRDAFWRLFCEKSDQKLSFLVRLKGWRNNTVFAWLDFKLIRIHHFKFDFYCSNLV